jgi:hypothetical protein
MFVAKAKGGGGSFMGTPAFELHSQNIMFVPLLFYKVYIINSVNISKPTLLRCSPA